MNDICNKAVDGLKQSYVWLLLVLVVVVPALIYTCCGVKDKTVRCDNRKALEILKEKNIADLTEASDNFMVQKIGEDYRIVFSDEMHTDSKYQGEFARFHMSEEKDSVKAAYNKSQTLIEKLDKDINEVQCTVPVTFSGFSTKDKAATLSGVVSYTIHANDKGYFEVRPDSLTEMFRSNFKPIYSKRQNRYFQFTYKTGEGEIIDNANELPQEEFGEFFDPLDY